jgi:hypothetical protein
MPKVLSKKMSRQLFKKHFFMKKYILSVLVALAATISFSAFSVPKKAIKSPDAQLAYWYTVSSNTVQALYAQNMSESEIKTEGAPCNDNGSIVCLVGSDSQLTLNSTINPDDFEADEKIAHN